MEGVPSTLYGVYKRANEGTASVYAAEQGVPSVGLRPHTVYGPGRDQGLTSAPTVAMLHAAAGAGVHDPVRRPVPDAVRAGRGGGVRRGRAAGRGRGGRGARGLGGPSVGTEDVIAAIEAVVPGAAIGFDAKALPFPSATGSGEAPTPLDAGVADAVARFRALLERGLVAV